MKKTTGGLAEISIHNELVQEPEFEEHTILSSPKLG